MKLQSIINLKENGILPFQRFRRKSWKTNSFFPNKFISFDVTNNMVEDDNIDGGGSRYWGATYTDLIANDWEWFEEKAWYEK